MCTIALLLGVTDAPLVIAANRDELYARPTRPPERWPQGFVAGVDVIAGGTWLAVRGDGRFAAVTNQRVGIAPPPGLKSRGLVVAELAMAGDPDAYVAALDPRAYASMNLAWGDASHASVAYLRHEGGLEIARLHPGVHVLTNDRIGSSAFPRAAALTAAIEPHLRAAWPELASALHAALGVHAQFGGERPELSATCIHIDIYGTRSSTIVAIDHGRVRAYLHADGPPCTTPHVDRSELFRA